MSAALLRGLVGTGPLLLDFDGPVCSIFSGLPAPRVAADLVQLLRRIPQVEVTEAVEAEADPLAVLRWAGHYYGPDITTAVEDALCEYELQAVQSAAPTPYGREVILAARRAGLPVAIVSNNSAGAITAYLSMHGLDGHVSAVVGRPYARPDSMKPDPGPVLDAVREVDSNPDECVLVGDSMFDIVAARAAGVRVIAYANRPSKVVPFASADAVIRTMSDVVEALTPVSPVSPVSPERTP